MRKKIDETLSNMYISENYRQTTLFYAHMLAQVNIKIENIPAPAGVSYELDHYNLYINDELFGKYNLNDRIFILIHEMLHILMGHLNIREFDNKELANIAHDTAINQLIPNLSIPDDALLPSSKCYDNAKKKESSEYYYNLLVDKFGISNKSDIFEKSNKSDIFEKSNISNETDNTNETDIFEKSNISNETDNTNKNNNFEYNKLDIHDTWSKAQETEFSEDLMNDVTSKMIEQAIFETQKERGDLPADIEKMVNLFYKKPQINWKKVLRKIIGNRKVGKRSTIMKKPRRFNNRPDLKGVAKNRSFNLICIVDISGSMSDSEILTGLSEVSNICKTNNTIMKVIQVDVEVKKDSFEEFTKNTRIFTRRGTGGTYIASAVKYLRENKIQYDALLCISDMMIENVPEDKYWKSVNTPVLWLTSHQIPEWNKWKKHQVFKLTPL